jgi:RHS repeat-associated protein
VPGGGGGSSWAASLGSAVRYDQGVRLGHGYVRISWPPTTPGPVTAEPGSSTFSNTGAPQWFTVPDGVSAVAVDLHGAQGGNASHGGLGARVRATLAVSPGDILQVNVGGQGALNAAGFNGGGYALDNGSGGGGASDLRKNGVTLADRVVVAGGGGGAGRGATPQAGSGGGGGAPNGTAGQAACGGAGGGGGTQTAGGAAGVGDWTYGNAGGPAQGANGPNGGGGGGGGGYYGGGSGGGCLGSPVPGGGGGSSWVSGTVAIDATMWSNVQSGNGQLTITWPVPLDATRSFGIDSYGEFVNQVFLGSGNLVESATDVEVDTAGPDLALSRTYNSLDSTPGWFGTGWSSSYEQFAAVDDMTGDVIVKYPDGRRERHRHNPDGTFTAPLGYVSALSVHPGGGWDLRQKYHSLATFDAQGRLVALVDQYGRSLSFVYAGTQLASVTDPASGRSLSFTWTGTHLETVSTGAVSGPGYSGPLTWRYVYSGDLLTKVCDARNNDPVTGYCTSYGYTGGKLTSITRPKGNTSLTVAYRADGRVDWTENGAGNRVTYAYWDGVSAVTDARGYLTYHFFDPAYRTTLLIDPAGGLTSYTYDANGFRSKVSDPNGNTVSLGYDARGNLASQTNAEGETTWFAYDASDNLTARRDGRSSGPTDDTYKTTFTYNSAGDKLTETSPATAEHPGGVTQTWTYTAGGENHGFGPVPAGLLRTMSDGVGTTTYAYDPAGDLRQVTTPSGLQTAYGRDGLGRVTAETLTWDGGASATTTRTWDQLGQPLTVTEPALTSTAGGAPVTHQKETATDYDANSNAWRVTVRDLGDAATATPARATTVDFDNADRPWRTTDPEGGITSRTFDANGNVATVTDAEGRVHRTDYDERNRPVAVTLVGFVDDPVGGSTPRDVVLSRVDYDAAGRKTAEYTPRPGTGGRAGQLDPASTPMAKRRFVYDKADRPLSVTFEAYTDRAGATRDVVLQSWVYDDAGNPTTVRQGGNLSVVTNVFDAAARLQTATLEMGADDRVSEFDYDPVGRPTRQSATQGSSTVETRLVYDAAGRLVSSTVENGAADLTTTFGYDQRGLRISTVDPRGNAAGADPADFESEAAYDPVGRLVEELAPPVAIEEVGGVAVTGRPATRYGYDAAGNQAVAVDPRGNVTRRSFDRLERLVRIDHPAYTPPGGSTLTPFEAYAYDRVGNLVASTDRRGQTTDFDFDARNRVVRQRDPLVAGETARGTTLFSWDDAGQRASTTDPTGSVTRFGSDDLGRLRTQTAVVRQDAPAGTYTATFDYDDLNNPTYLQDPAGVTTTKAYTPASELVSVIDALGKTTSFGYDAAGRRTFEVDPLGRRVEHVYDPAGRETSTVYKEPGSGVVLATEYRSFDAAGNLSALRSPRSASASDDTYRTSFVYDALGRLGQVSEPDAAGPLVTSYGYDAAGNTTRVTDGRSNVTTGAFTPWNTKASTVEPATPGQTALAERTFAVAYDAAGLPTSETQPGVTVTRAFDALGRLTTETGSGSGVATATRGFGYDLAGRRTRAGHPAGDVTFGYDDRGLLLSASVPGSATAQSSFRYDSAGRMTSRTDAAGTTTFTYTGRGELDVATDPLTGVATNFDWNDAGQVAAAGYGTSPAATRTYTYDGRGRLDTDTLTRAGTTLAGFDYDYDPEGNLTAQTTLAPDNPAAGTLTYGYDRSGRLASAVLPLPSYATVVSESSPVGYWRLGETAGTVAADASGWGRAGTYQNDPALGRPGLLAGDPDPAVGLTRALGGLGLPVENYVDLPALPLANTSFTVEAWIAPETSPPDSQVVFGSDDALPSQALALRVRADGRLTLAYGLDELTAPPGTVAFGATSHVVAAYDAATDTSTLSVDGTQVASGPQGPFAAAGASFAVGRLNATTPETFVGVIDEVSVYDRALPPDERALHRQAGTKSSPTYTAAYGYDPAGNRTRAGTQTFAYDARNRLTAGAGRAYAWDPRGTLAGVTALGATTPVDFDALGRQSAWGTTTSAYDALDRLATRGATAFTYAGSEVDPVALGDERYARTPAGDLLALEKNGVSRLVGENRHGDLAWLLDPAATLTDSRVWDPYGRPLGATGTTAPSLGYQGDYTDPDSGNVWMGARWYQPGTGTFTTRDTIFGMLKTPISLNRYTYAQGDPLQFFDPDGHWPAFVDRAVKTVTRTVDRAWDATGGRAVTAVNDHVVQPVVRTTTATVGAVKSTTATLTRTVGRATRRSAQFVRRNAKTIARVGAVTLAAGGTFVGCTVATGGVAVVGCGAAAGAVGGAVNSAFDCPGKSAAACAKGVAIGTVSGGAAGAVAGAIGAGAAGGAVVRAVGAGFAGGATHSVSNQALASGRVDLGDALREGIIGAATGGALHGAGSALRGIRGARASATSEMAGAPQTARPPLFSQTTASPTFKNGPFAGQSIGDVTGGLRAGKMTPDQLPIDVIARNGETISLNTRSTLALRRAGVDPSDWVLNDVTGVPSMEQLLTERLARNGLSGGTDVLRITGAGPSASNLQ